MRKIFNSKSFIITILALCFGAMPLCVFGDVMTEKGGTYIYLEGGEKLHTNQIFLFASYSKDVGGDKVRIMTKPLTTPTGHCSSYIYSDYTNNEMPSTITLTDVNSGDNPYEYSISYLDKDITDDSSMYLYKNVIITNCNKHYLTAGSTTNSISINESNSYNWKIRVYKNSNPTVVTDNNNRNLSLYANNASLGCFSNINTYIGTIINPASIYKKVFPITISEVGYATFYNGTNDVVLPEGITAYTYSYSADKLTIANTIEAGQKLPHGTAVVIKGEPGTYYLDILAAASDNSEQNADNLLRGSDNDATTTAPTSGSYQFYYLSNGDGGLGFYWGAADGVAFQNKANRAYLCIPTASASKVTSFTLPDDSTPATEVKASNTNGKASAYDISGKAFGNKRHSIRIENGKKFMVK